MNSTGSHVVRIEAEALRALAERLAGPMAEAFDHAVALLYGCNGRVVVTGLGKSGLIARKVAATLSSTGTPALFLHPAEAAHGDLGMIVRGDIVLALSYSGETDEILDLLPAIKRLAVPLLAITCDSTLPTRAAMTSTSSRAAAVTVSPRRSTLAQASDIVLDCSVAQEACSLGLAPTASTTAMLALGDALAVALAEKRGFKEDDFAGLHPGGKLGKRLARVAALMHSGEAIPRVSRETRMPEVIYEMSRKGLGLTTVVEDGKLLGVISDGDLRRLLEKVTSERSGASLTDITAAECMTRSPRTIRPDEFATAALNVMEQKKITSLPVVDSEGLLVGILHLHDLWGTQML